MKVLDGINDGLATWLLAQPMFFVATAPLAEDGHVNKDVPSEPERSRVAAFVARKLVVERSD